jgi:glycosyltransferase involved in cell wall biosynthesis
MTTPVHLAHQWWVSRRGGERLFEETAQLFPEAPISTLFLRRETLSPAMRDRDWRVSPLGRIAPRLIEHRKLLPLFPWATRRLSAGPGTRLLLSSDASVIKGMRKPPGCVHVCYCNSPPRYLWDMADDYLSRTSGLGTVGRSLFRHTLRRLQTFDLRSSGNVDHFIGNSRFISARIKRIYGRESATIHPAVDVARFQPSGSVGDFYLIVTELVSYKRVDLAVQACARLGRKLVVVGDGAELARLKVEASGCNITFLGRAPDAQVASLMAQCRAFLYPQLEDFGISAVEAQAAGRPVIAFGTGGALDTVIDGKTGLFFPDQTTDSLAHAILAFEAAESAFRPENCRANAERFRPDRYRAELSQYLSSVVPDVVT